MIMLTVYPIAIIVNLGFPCDTTGVSWGTGKGEICDWWKIMLARIFDNTKGLGR